MNCHEATRLIDAWLDGELSAAQQRALKGHLAGCDDCRRACETQSALSADLKALGRAADELADPAQSMARHGARTVPRWWTAPLRVAAVVAISAGALLLARAWLGPPRDAHDVPPRLHVDAESMTREPAERPAVILAADRSQMTVEVESSNPRIRIVWLYDAVEALPAEEKVPTSLPASSTEVSPRGIRRSRDV